MAQVDAIVQTRGRPARPRSSLQITFVATVGPGSMDLCARELARRLPVPTLRTDVYQRAAAARNRAFLSAASLRSAAHGAAFVRRLRALDTAVHLPNHHLARYALASKRPYVVTVHDLIRHLDCERDEALIHRPNRRDRATLAADYRAIASADAVIAVSAATRRDVIERLGVPADRVFVIHNGLDHERFRPGGERPLRDRYVLFVGTEHPRKNLATLLRALRRLKDAGAADGLKLAKVGDPGGGEAPFRARTEQLVEELGLQDEVVFTGRVPDEELPAWYSHAECMVLPSLCEGFGNPPLEAMACGCPVVVSDTPALVEVVDGAGLVAPPTDDATLAEALRALLGDDGLRAELRERGLARSRAFSWDRAAQLTLDVYAWLARRG
jgi:glycosyltransferase involved in cell wall biosynthesis